MCVAILSRFVVEGAAAVTGPGLNLFPSSINLFLLKERKEERSPADILHTSLAREE